MSNREQARIRWGVQHDFARRGETPHWRTLGTGWIDWRMKLPSCVDFWPASYRTRHEARAAVRDLTTETHRHSPHWRFRTVKLELRTREVGR